MRISREPTPEMVNAGMESTAVGCCVPNAQEVATIWRAMFDALPVADPPADVEGRARELLPSLRTIECDDWEPNRLRNADGPRAAELIEHLLAALSQPSSREQRLVEALQEIVDESVFNQQRFAEDTDADYFLRCFKAVKERARAALGGE